MQIKKTPEIIIKDVTGIIHETTSLKEVMEFVIKEAVAAQKILAEKLD